MPQGVEVQVLSATPVPRRLTVGQRTLNPFTVVRIHAGQQKFYFSSNLPYRGLPTGRMQGNNLVI